MQKKQDYLDTLERARPYDKIERFRYNDQGKGRWEMSDHLWKNHDALIIDNGKITKNEDLEQEAQLKDAAFQNRI